LEVLLPDSSADPQSAELRQRWEEAYRNPNQNAEGFDFIASADQVRSVASLGDLPLVVITAGRSEPIPGFPADSEAKYAQVWLELQKELAQLSTKSAHIIAQESGHNIPFEQPKVIIDALHKLVEDARAR
jgi:hypothetical protein